jgi:hypothetical protein
MRVGLLCVALLVAAGVCSGVLPQEDVLELDDTTDGIPGGISLAEVQEQASDESQAQAQLTLEESAEAKVMFMSMIDKLKTGKIRGAALFAARSAEDTFDDMGESAGGSGLDVIFKKLKELETEITDQQESEKARMDAFNSQCNDELKKQSDIITLTTKTRNDLKRQTGESNVLIKDNRRTWRLSRNQEDITHKAMIDLQSAREESRMAVRAMVDERNKAIDVMQTALFLVCERFARFKNGKTCLKVKSQPDVAEPRRFETNPLEEAEQQDKDNHDANGLGADWAAKWAAKKAKDQDLENNPEPEQIPGLEDDSAETDELGDDAEPDKPKAKETLAQVMADDDPDAGDWKLSSKEKRAHKKLATLASTEMPDKYKLPLVELSESIQMGSERRSRSIVEILMDVLRVTKEDLAKIKTDHTIRLNTDYDTSWDLKDTLNSQRISQDEMRAIMEANRNNILNYNDEGEKVRVDQDAAIAAKHTTEDVCNLENEEYGVEESWRIEDLENLMKLKSILRMLYYKKKPLNCPHHPQTKAKCSGMDRGWCVYSELHPDETQRCSCNVGFYGDACQYTMCPGIALNLYEHDAPGVCSNTNVETRGSCDKNTGLCTCYDGEGVLRGQSTGVNPEYNLPDQVNGGYYHGPKRACDFKNAPPSKNGQIDNKCSDNGDIYINNADPNHPITYSDGYDKIRGICHCKYENWGPACEFKKCPHSNGNLYPSISSNACNGHGACSDETGRCTCKMPYHCGQSCGGNAGMMTDEEREDASNEQLQELIEGTGDSGPCSHTCPAGQSCAFEDCAEDCRASGKSSCNTQNGQCSCAPGTSGHACEFFDCPGSDPGSNLCGSGGECNRNDGVCICRIGYSGPKCEKTQRCTGKLDSPYMNWWTIWDKPGWITCTSGQLMYKLKRSLCDALSCINSGACAAGCEGTEHVFQLRHCYHDLRWYNSFDVAGWSKCLDDYYVAGLYRSGESLYELQMAKCCSLMDARWVNCDEANWNSIFAGPGTGTIDKKPNIAFITGFKRGVEHTIKGIDGASYCGFVRGY